MRKELENTRKDFEDYAESLERELASARNEARSGTAQMEASEARATRAEVESLSFPF